MLRSAQPKSGFTLIELIVVLAIISAVMTLATTATSQWFSNLRLRASAQLVDAAFSYARSEAIQTGSVHLVFFQLDAQGNPLLDRAGNTVPVLVVNDGWPGTPGQNCKIDSGEVVRGFSLEDDVRFGLGVAASGVPADGGGGDPKSGSTFVDPGGNDVTWTLFRPEGTTMSFAANCSTGAIGSGAGGIYFTNGVRDVAVVVTPLGASRVHAYDGNWSG